MSAVVQGDRVNKKTAFLCGMPLRFQHISTSSGTYKFGATIPQGKENLSDSSVTSDAFDMFDTCLILVDTVLTGLIRCRYAFIDLMTHFDMCLLCVWCLF